MCTGVTVEDASPLGQLMVLACGAVPPRTRGLPDVHGARGGRLDVAVMRVGDRYVVTGRERQVARPVAPHSGHELGGIGPQADTTVPSG